MSEDTQGSLIGFYSKPEENLVKSEDKPQPSAARSMADGIQEDLAQGVKETENTNEKSQNYEEILRENNLTVEDAASIVDDMLTQGFYEERVEITRRITCTFRTRTHGDYLRYHNALEVLNPRFEEEQNEIALRYCLAGSLVRFKDKEFDFPDVEKVEASKLTDAFDTRLTWIEKQPERIIALLAVKLNKFDRKVSLVMSEGVIENF